MYGFGFAPAEGRSVSHDCPIKQAKTNFLFKNVFSYHVAFFHFLYTCGKVPAKEQPKTVSLLLPIKTEARLQRKERVKIRNRLD